MIGIVDTHSSVETGHFTSLPFHPLHTELLNTVPTHHISYG